MKENCDYQFVITANVYIFNPKIIQFLLGKNKKVCLLPYFGVIQVFVQKLVENYAEIQKFYSLNYLDYRPSND